VIPDCGRAYEVRDEFVGDCGRREGLLCRTVRKTRLRTEALSLRITHEEHRPPPGAVAHQRGHVSRHLSSPDRPTCGRTSSLFHMRRGKPGQWVSPGEQERVNSGERQGTRCVSRQRGHHRSPSSRQVLSTDPFLLGRDRLLSA